MMNSKMRNQIIAALRVKLLPLASGSISILTFFVLVTLLPVFFLADNYQSVVPGDTPTDSFKRWSIYGALMITSASAITASLMRSSEPQRIGILGDIIMLVGLIFGFSFAFYLRSIFV